MVRCKICNTPRPHNETESTLRLESRLKNSLSRNLAAGSAFVIIKVREKCDADEDRLDRLARSSFDHLLPAQGSVKAGPRVTILRPGNKVPSQREQSAGSLWPNRCQPAAAASG
jgi:hypothetical protein